MAKRAHRRSLRYDRDRAGCMWSFIRIFDFRRSVSSRKLLADRRQTIRAGGASSLKLTSPDHSENGVRVEDIKEREVATCDEVKTRVKQLMHEDMINKSTHKNLSNDDIKVEAQPFESTHRLKPTKKTNGILRHSRNLSLSGLDDDVTRTGSEVSSSRYKVCSSSDLHCSTEEQLSSAIEVFINHKMKNSNIPIREEVEINSDKSKELTDALEILRSNKELFHRLLQDPNSNLVKHIESLDDGLQKEADDEITEHNKQQPQRSHRRTKSQGSSHSSSKIVILKPGPIHNKVPSERNSSLFSFTEIKRKLKHVMGKEHREIISPEIKKRVNNNEKGINGDNVGWSSPNRNHFYTERFAKPLPSTCDYHPKKRVPDIYLEAKKHIFEMLDSGEEKEGSSMSGNLSKSLGRILSFPTNYYSSSRSSSSNSFSSEDQIRFPQRRVEANVLSTGAVQDSQETSRSKCQEDERVSNASHDLSSSSITINTDSSYVTVSFCEESSEMTIESLETELQGAEHILSPPDYAHSFESRKDDPDCAMDRTERPSPISVLDPLCMEDDISPSSTPCQSVEPEIQPRKIHFDEPANSTVDQPIRTCLESEETAFEYVEAVLLGSDLNWDDFLSRWLSSDQILDPSLFDEVELFSSRSCHDQKLLFDCTNEVLKDVIDQHFPIVRQSIRPRPKGMDLIHEVWNGVEWHLLKHSTTRSLDQLVSKQLARSGEWLDLHFDIGNIGFVIESAVLEDLLEEIIIEALLGVISTC
ncbi:unnamed protein product [Cuscuta europaea]|uniref:DUF4378 domain-containing protein n=1 Tax=Cuscuta europaea TaxID=41803 RepID=A0A9P1EDT1_CUSEU|nr:unnamed protein product [Cuscuta europaea]